MDSRDISYREGEGIKDIENEGEVPQLKENIHEIVIKDQEWEISL